MAALVLALACLALGNRAAPAAEPIRLRVVGGLDQISQYVRYEAPFWTVTVPQITGGRVVAEIAPFDRSGIRGQEMLQLMRLGVVTFGTVLLGPASAEEPLLGGVDLPILSPDMAALRDNVAAWRPRIRALLQERYGLHLLAVYAYPAQVLGCTRPFRRMSDIPGRRVRVSSVAQGELVTAMGGTAQVVPFAEIVSGIKAGLFDCAITGTLSGNTIGLHEVTTHISSVAISWGLSVFAANDAAWGELPEDLRELLQRSLIGLEAEIWAAAERETQEGLACDTGRPGCVHGRPGRMVEVPDQPENLEHRRALLHDVVLPAWIRRCGEECAQAWEATLGPHLGVSTRVE